MNKLKIDKNVTKARIDDLKMIKTILLLHLQFQLDDTSIQFYGLS